MASVPFLGLIGWYFIPHFVTRQLLRFRSTFLSKPSADPRREYRFLYTFVVLCYALYNLVQGARGIEGNFYQILNVGKEVDESGIVKAFRAFARRHHPDKVGVDGEAYFVQVRSVVEALKDPLKRTAYEKFGPEVLNWPALSTEKEYLYRGLMQSSGYHVVSGLVLFVISNVTLPFVGNTTRQHSGRIVFWRYILFFTLLAFELQFLLYPVSAPTQSPFASLSSVSTRSPSSLVQDFWHTLLTQGILATFFPDRVAYQHIRFLHHVFVFLSAALGHVGPLFASFVPGERADEMTEWERAEVLAGMVDHQASVLLHTELASIHRKPMLDIAYASTPRAPLQSQEFDSHKTGVLLAEMEEMIVEKNLMQDAGPMKEIWEEAVRKSQRGGRQLAGSTVYNTTGVLVAELEPGAKANLKAGVRARSVSCNY